MKTLLQKRQQSLSVVLDEAGEAVKDELNNNSPEPTWKTDTDSASMATPSCSQEFESDLNTESEREIFVGNNESEGNGKNEIRLGSSYARNMDKHVSSSFGQSPLGGSSSSLKPGPLHGAWNSMQETIHEVCSFIFKTPGHLISTTLIAVGATCICDDVAVLRMMKW